LWSHGWRALQSNGWQVWLFAQDGLGLGLVPLAYGLIHGGWRWWHCRRVPGWETPTPALVLALWLAPPMLFYALVHIGDRGYSFSYLPGLCIAAGAGLRLLARDAVRLAHRYRDRYPTFTRGRLLQRSASRISLAAAVNGGPSGQN